MEWTANFRGTKFDFLGNLLKKSCNIIQTVIHFASGISLIIYQGASSEEEVRWQII